MNFWFLFTIVINFALFGDCCYLSLFDICLSPSTLASYVPRFHIKLYELLPSWKSFDNSDYTVQFHLYTQARMNDPVIVDSESADIITTFGKHFDPAKLTFITCHGYYEVPTSPMNRQIREAYLKHHDVNLIIVDWSHLSKMSSYKYIVKKVDQIYTKVAKVITTLKDKGGMDLDRVTLIGYSVGAHIFGVAGKMLKGEIGALVALDPANPEFESLPDEIKLSRTDAKYVLVIHTNAGQFGYLGQLGMADFYAGDGTFQPDCLMDPDFMCSHGRAWQYFIESINSKDGFWGRMCRTVNAARCSGSFLHKQPCADGILVKMGGFVIDRTIHGIYHFDTNGRPPFAKSKDSS